MDHIFIRDSDLVAVVGPVMRVLPPITYPPPGRSKSLNDVTIIQWRQQNEQDSNNSKLDVNRNYFLPGAFLFCGIPFNRRLFDWSRLLPGNACFLWRHAVKLRKGSEGTRMSFETTIASLYQADDNLAKPNVSGTDYTST
jgi:hypothetical protein